MKVKTHREQSILIVFQGKYILVLNKNSKKEQDYTFINAFLNKKDSPESALINRVHENLDIYINEKDIEYQCSITIDLNKNQRLSKHYFTCSKEKISSNIFRNNYNTKWIPWEDVLEFLNEIDQKIITELFEPCNF